MVLAVLTVIQRLDARPNASSGIRATAALTVIRRLDARGGVATRQQSLSRWVPLDVHQPVCGAPCIGGGQTVLGGRVFASLGGVT